MNNVKQVISIQGLDQPVQLLIGKNNHFSVKVGGIEIPTQTIIADHIEHRGRPVDPNSARQQKLQGKQYAKPGRPPKDQFDENVTVIHQEEPKQLGRPIDYTSERQLKIAERMARSMSGLTVQRGRPKQTS